MHGIGIIFIIIWIIRHQQNKSGASGPSSANKSPPLYYFFVWSAVFIAQMFAVNSEIYPFSLASNLLLFPSVFAQLSIRMGLVKASFWLGRFSLFVHRYDPFGGALFYGWKALKKLPEPEQKTHKEWLERKLAGYSKTLGSGAILMCGLLKTDGCDNETVLHHFSFLRGCNRNWIPNNMGRYIFKYLLVRTCENKNWENIRELSRYWQSACWDPFASWVYGKFLMGVYKKIYLSDRIGSIWYYCLSGFPKIRPYLSLMQVTNDSPSISNDLGTLLKLKAEEMKVALKLHSDQSHLNKSWQIYLNDKARDDWMKRTQELGCFNDEEIFLRLQTSVRDQISLRSGEGDLLSEIAMQERDKQFKLLKIKIRALTQRTEQKKVMTGIQEYEEFLAIVKIAEQLGKDDNTRSQVFFQMRSPCWNWVVELWNNKRNKPLAFLVCSYMAPMAGQYGDADAHRFFFGIINDRFK